MQPRVAPPRGERGLKSVDGEELAGSKRVAPPRGERGLKFDLYSDGCEAAGSRSPSWGAWIEIHAAVAVRVEEQASLPLVGSVD